MAEARGRADSYRIAALMAHIANCLTTKRQGFRAEDFLRREATSAGKHVDGKVGIEALRDVFIRRRMPKITSVEE